MKQLIQTKTMKQIINRILIGVLFLFGVLLIPAGQVKADSLRDEFHRIQINTVVMPADTIPLEYGLTTNEKMVISVNIQNLNNYCNMNPITTRNIYLSITVGYAETIYHTSTLSECGGSDYFIIYPLAPSIAGITNVVFDFGNNVTITTSFFVVDPPTPTVTVDAYNNSDSSSPVLLSKDANDVTTQGIASLTPIKLYWVATGFNNTNIVCTLPNNLKESQGVSYGFYSPNIGPSITTKYSVSCTDN